MTLVVRAPNTREAERRYILDVVLGEWLGLDYELILEARSDVSLRVRDDASNAELRLADVLLATPEHDWLSARSLPARPVERFDFEAAQLARPDSADVSQPVRPLPILFGAQSGGRWLHATPKATDLGIDIFGSVFFMIARYEELVVEERDEFERFPASASVASAEGYIDRPLADEYVDLLWRVLCSLWPNLVRRSTSFRLRLTHDVDRPWATLGHSFEEVTHSLGGDLLVRRDPRLAARRVRAALDARSGRVDRDPSNTFGMLMDTSERHGLRSTFYFMAGATDPRFDGSYEISDPPVIRLIQEIHDRGHDVGLHASYNTFNSPAAMRLEFEHLRATCEAVGFDSDTWGVRQHYLRFETPTTWRNQQAAGLAYDSSLGFAELNGFRTGTCREYPVFDLREGAALTLRERPLIIMDAASDEYLAMDLERAAASIVALVAECRRHKGDAVLLYHNSSMPGAAQQAHYRELVASLVQPG